MLPPVIITTVPFSSIDPAPEQALVEAGTGYRINPLGRKLRPEEVAGMIRGHRALIAGTEPLTAEIMDSCPDLEVICRVGIGLDSVDLHAARERNIAVSYTPDGPSPAVAELAVGLMADLLRGISRADRTVRNNGWDRIAGRRLSLCTVGIIGAGRIGSRVLRHLAGGFPGIRLLATDPDPRARAAVGDLPGLVWTDMQTILAEADIVSLHIPLSARTRGLVGRKELAAMRPDAVLLNTARGGIVDESALAEALAGNVIAAAAVDVFEQEPYSGPLQALENVTLTCHMGSMTQDCRAKMEIEATRDAIRFLSGQPLQNPVPESEYEAQAIRNVPAAR